MEKKALQTNFKKIGRMWIAYINNPLISSLSLHGNLILSNFLHLNPPRLVWGDHWV